MDKLNFFSTLKNLNLGLKEQNPNLLYSNFNIKLDLDLILVNKEHYSKALFVDGGINDALLNTVDNHDNFRILISETKGLGHYFYSKPFNFRHKLTDKIFFSINIYPFCNKYGFFLNNLNKLFYCLERYNLKSSKSCMGLIFLHPNRGGFCCIYIGVFGFLPKKHVEYLIPSIFSSYKQKRYGKVNALLFSKTFYSIFFARIYWSFITKIRSLKFVPKTLKLCNYNNHFRKRKKRNQKILFKGLLSKAKKRPRRRNFSKKFFRIIFFVQK